MSQGLKPLYFGLTGLSGLKPGPIPEARANVPGARANVPEARANVQKQEQMQRQVQMRGFFAALRMTSARGQQ